MPPLVLAYVPKTGLLFGLLLVGAIVGGYVAHLLRIPRVVGYLTGGAALQLLLNYGLKIQPGSDEALQLSSAEGPLRAVQDLGLGIILFTIGGIFETRHLRALGRRLFKLVAAESGLTALFVFVGTLLAGFIIRGTAEPGVTVCFAALLGLAAIATAPAATLFTFREYEAKGPVTDAVLSVVGLNNVICIIAFNVAFLSLAALGALGEVSLSARDVWLGLLLQTVGSVLLGLILGFGISVLHTKLRLGDALLVLTAALIVLGAGEDWLLRNRGYSYNFLLTAICTGAVFANIAIDPDRLENALRTMGQPILVGFFVIAGYRLHLGELGALGLVGVVYVACRIAGKTLGASLGTRWLRHAGELHPYLGAALLCQAAVVIGLADFVRSHWQHAWAAQAFATTVLGSVVIFELCGPLMIKWTAVRSGEVKAATLLRRAGSISAEGDSVTSLTWHALLRTFGLGATATTRRKEPLQARHVMRTSVKCMHAAERLDEVLHFIEHSRYNHFPVVNENEELVGVVHFSDIRNIIYDPTLRQLVTAADLANPKTPAVPVNLPLAEVLDIFHNGDIGSLPVLDSPGSRRVVGIIEQRDVLRVLHRSQESI